MQTDFISKLVLCTKLHNEIPNYTLAFCHCCGLEIKSLRCFFSTNWSYHSTSNNRFYYFYSIYAILWPWLTVNRKNIKIYTLVVKPKFQKQNFVRTKTLIFCAGAEVGICNYSTCCGTTINIDYILSVSKKEHCSM